METTEISSNKKVQLICIALIFFGILALVSTKLLNRQQDAGRATNTQTEQSAQQIPEDTDTIALDAGVASKLEVGAIVADISTENATNAELDTDAQLAVTQSEEVHAEEGTDSDSNAVSEEENEYANLAIANVDHYVNVRSGPNTDSNIVGKMYDGSVAQIQSTAGENNEWFQVVSGNVEGYIKAEYFIYGEDAAKVIDEYVTRYAVVQADRLNVRKEPDISSKRIGYIDNGEKAKLIEWGDEWSKVSYSEKEGFVATEYITVAEEFVYAKSIEEEQAELAALREQQARANASEEKVPERAVISVVPPQTNYATVSELRSAVVDYAMQYLGNRYVHGGQSLASGTDCSGFTCYVYATFGYGLSRTPQGQYTSAGRSISMEEIQPGDIICYSSNGSSCTHVGLYIGNGQIIHAANSRKGVIISNYNYSRGESIIGIRSIVD